MALIPPLLQGDLLLWRQLLAGLRVRTNMPKWRLLLHGQMLEVVVSLVSLILRCVGIFAAALIVASARLEWAARLPVAIGEGATRSAHNMDGRKLRIRCTHRMCNARTPPPILSFSRDLCKTEIPRSQRCSLNDRIRGSCNTWSQ